MSVAYQSWEVASGPTMGYKMAVQSNMCDVLAPDASNYITGAHRSTEPFMKTVLCGSDGLKGFTFPNHYGTSLQDTVIRGISSLSLHTLTLLETNSPLEDLNCMPVFKSSSKSLELHHRALMGGNESSFFSSGACPSGVQGTIFDSHKSSAFDQKLVQHYSISSVHCNEGAGNAVNTGSSIFPSYSTSGLGKSTRTSIRGDLCPPHEGFGVAGLHGFSNTYCRPRHALDVVAEDKPWEEGSTLTCDHLELDTFSSSSANSLSSVHDTAAEVSTSSGEGLHGTGEAEVESDSQGPSSFSMCSPPPRKGLSRFYAGKSRSFSCLADVVSLKDLSKPENPYAKRRKCNVGRNSNFSRSQLPPLQKGPASISKKPPYCGKSTLALAVAMSTRDEVLGAEDKDNQMSAGMPMWQSSPLTSRSYSLSDLQGVAGSHISPS